MDFIQNICAAIDKYKLIEIDEKIILGISGGMDSMVLLDIVIKYIAPKYNINIAIAHLDHGIRQESIEEAILVAEAAKKYSLPFYIRCENIVKYHNKSIEERSRKIRYDFLYKCAIAFKAKKIMVAHHADDQAETVLFNITRGCGIVGLAGIPHKRYFSLKREKMELIRPLLSITKKEIWEYSQKHNISWIEDASNFDIQFERNKIRHNLIPQLKEFNDKITTSLFRTTSLVQDLIIFLEQQAEIAIQDMIVPLCKQEKLKRILECQNFLVCAFSSTKFQKSSSSLKPFIIRLILEKLSLEVSLREKHYAMIEKLCVQKNGIVKLGNSILVQKKTDTMYIYQSFSTCSWKKQLDREICIDNMIISTTKNTNNNISSNLFLQSIDADKIHFPIYLRTWNSSDIMEPMGLLGNKKISKILADIKLHAPFRNIIPIVSDKNDTPIWLIGVCISEKVKVDTTTKNTLTITICEKQ